MHSSTPHSSPMTSSPAQQLLDASLANFQQPIAQLPTEILLAIFEYCSYWDTDEDDPSDFLVWTSVLHVCRHWYWAGVSYPMLWQIVCSDASEAYLRAILRRSQDLPVSIYILSNFTPRCARLLLKEAHRIRYLHVEIEFSSMSKMTDIIRHTRGIPRLEYLKLYIINDGDGVASGVKLNELFPFSLPSLHRLDVITSCDISRILDAPNLETLSLESMFSELDGFDAAFFELVPFLSALQKMPRLSNLTLSHMRPWYGPGVDMDNIEPTLLPNVYGLTLQGPAYAYTWLCEHLLVPVTASIGLELYVGADSEVDMVISSLVRLFSGNPRTPRVLRSVVLASTPRGLTVEGTSSRDDLLEPTTLSSDSTRPEFWLYCKPVKVRDSRERPVSLEGLSALLEALPLSDMRALNIVGYKARNNLVPRSLRGTYFDGVPTDTGRVFQHFLRSDVVSDRANLTSGSEKGWKQMFPNLQVLSWDPRSSCNASS
ncbi:F-box protein [Phanerochaete sordida]|uniref:F-box protein n=1 Tax=Phanerochaete sordida TaxID=48140 RepID=A0A9P3LGM7_9APHY|nr:F-box protein [Phanerochaete sordida]